MSGDNVCTVNIGTLRRKEVENSAYVPNAENQLKRKKKKRPHKPNMWWFHTFFHLIGLCIALDKKGVFDNERKQTISTAAGVMGSATVQQNQEKVGRSSPGATAGKGNASNQHGPTPGKAVPVEKGGET